MRHALMQGGLGVSVTCLRQSWTAFGALSEIAVHLMEQLLCLPLT